MQIRGSRKLGEESSEPRGCIHDNAKSGSDVLSVQEVALE
jgi:hypothetical protein